MTIKQLYKEISPLIEETGNVDGQYIFCLMMDENKGEFSSCSSYNLIAFAKMIAFLASDQSPEERKAFVRVLELLVEAIKQAQKMGDDSDNKDEKLEVGSKTIN